MRFIERSWRLLNRVQYMGGVSSGGHQVIWNLVRTKGVKLYKEEKGGVDGNRFIVRAWVD